MIKLGLNIYDKVVTHVNLSDSGASSHRVVRTTMRYVIDSFKNKKIYQIIFLSSTGLELIEQR